MSDAPGVCRRQSAVIVGNGKSAAVRAALTVDVGGASCRVVRAPRVGYVFYNITQYFDWRSAGQGFTQSA